MKSNVACFLIVFMYVFKGFSQVKITWNELSDVKFEDKYFPSVDDYFLHPNFGKTVKDIEGKEIKITGYFLNIDPEGNIYLLSQNPMASCFFCGGAGPETIMEVRFKNKPHFKTDQIVTVRGIFNLNDKDINHCNYILENATGSLVK